MGKNGSEVDMSDYPVGLRDYVPVSYSRDGRDLRDVAEGRPSTPVETRLARKAAIAQGSYTPPTVEENIYAKFSSPEPVSSPVQRAVEAQPPRVLSQVVAAPLPEPPQERPESVLDRVLQDGHPEGTIVFSVLGIGDFQLHPENIRVTDDIIALQFASSREILFTPAKKAKLYGTILKPEGASLYGLFYSGIKFPAFSDENKVVMIFHLTGVEASKAQEEPTAPAVIEVPDSEFGFDPIVETTL